MKTELSGARPAIGGRNVASADRTAMSITGWVRCGYIVFLSEQQKTDRASETAKGCYSLPKVNHSL